MRQVELRPQVGLASAGGWAALVLFAFLAFLPALTTLPVTDRDEARFVQASRQMVESGDYVDIRFQDVPRYKKPVGIYWLQSAAVLATGQGPDAPLWVYRLPSLIGAVLSVVLVAVVGVPLFGRHPALLAAAVFAAGLVIAGEARIAKTDAALLATVLAAQAVLARLYLRNETGKAAVYAFWLAIAAGTLIKGPIGPMVPALTVLTLVALDRRGDWLRPLAAPVPIGLALLVTLPWFLAITLRSDGAFWTGSVGADLLPKIASGQEGKGAPPGSYLAAVWFTFWPGPALLLLALPAVWQARGKAATRFCLAWAIPLWLVYEAIPTKLIHYTLPVFPALALLAVGHLPDGLARAPNWLRLLAAAAMLPGLVVGVAALGFALTSSSPPAAVPVLLGLIVAGVLTGLALRAGVQGRPWRVVALAAFAGAGLHAGLLSTLARIPDLWPTDLAMAAASAVAAAQGCQHPRVTGWGYEEPSLVWRGGRETRLFPASAPESEVVRSGACEVVIHAVGGRVKHEEPPTGCQSAALVTGLAIGAGHWVTLDVLDCRVGP